MNNKQKIKHAVEEIKSGKNKTITIELENNKFNIKPFPILWFNKSVLFCQKWLVPCHFKNWLLRRTGMKVDRDACIPHYIEFDAYFPELINVGAGVLIGGDSKLCAHTVEGNKLTLGIVELKEKTMVGGMVTLLPGAIVNKHSMVSLVSEVDREIPEGEIWEGKPAKCILKLNQEQIDKYFKKVEMSPKQYYKEAKQKIKTFQKDKNQNYLKIYYGGTRAGAGNDWWRARNFFRIFYNGIIIEITRMLPNSWLKRALYKMVGVKIGKNCCIEKGCVFDHIYCDTITLEDNVRLDNECYLDGHEYTISQTIFGRIRLKKGCHLKHHVFVRTGTTIGENTIIEPWSMCQKEIPANERWGGIPAKFIEKVK